MRQKISISKPVREKTLKEDGIEVVWVKAFFDIKNNDWIDYPYSSFVFDYTIDKDLIKQYAENDQEFGLHYKLNFVWVPVSNLLKYLVEHWDELLQKAHACKTNVEVACFIMEQFWLAMADLHAQRVPGLKCMITYKKDINSI
jgi:hypothetical protein